MVINRILDAAIRRKIGENRFEEFQGIVKERPVVPKYDPEDFDPKELSPDEEEDVIKEMAEIFSHPLVGAVQIGGSYDVSPGKVAKTMEIIERAEEENPVFKLLEPGSPDDLRNSAGGLDMDLLTAPDAINKPSVWNTYDSEWKDGKHSEAQKLLRDVVHEMGGEALKDTVESDIREMLPGPLQNVLDPESTARGYVESIENPESYLLEGLDNRIIHESYLVVNPESAVAEKTDARDWLLERGIEKIDQESGAGLLEDEAMAMAAERKQNGYRGVLYIEGSGSLSPESIVESAYNRLNRHLGSSEDMLVAYGGGISNSEEIQTYLDSGADFVLVGNSVQEQGAEALPEPSEAEGF